MVSALAFAFYARHCLRRGGPVGTPKNTFAAQPCAQVSLHPPKAQWMVLEQLAAEWRVTKLGLPWCAPPRTRSPSPHIHRLRSLLGRSQRSRRGPMSNLVGLGSAGTAPGHRHRAARAACACAGHSALSISVSSTTVPGGQPIRSDQPAAADLSLASGYPPLGRCAAPPR